MSDERYEAQPPHLILSDPELGLHLQVAFSLHELPSDIESKAVFPSGEKLVLERDKERQVEKACLMLHGKMHGQCRLFYPSGVVKAEMFYHENALHGPSTFFSASGQVLSKSWFVFGKKMGKVMQFYPSGATCSIQRFKDGLQEGKQEFFYGDGLPKTLMHYKAGILNGEVKLYWPGAVLKREAFFVQGKREGWDKIWNKAHVLMDEGEYKEGGPVGLHRRMYDNGQVREEILYHSPNRFDRKEWDEHGKLVYEGVFARDKSYTERAWDGNTHTMQERRGFWDGKKICWK